MKRHHRYAVVGLGGIGSGAVYWLARRAGADVLGLEQFEIGHDRGASQDHSRIIRHSYHTPAYVELTKGAYAAWVELELDLGRSLILKTGGLDLWPRDSAISKDDYVESLDAGGIEYELLDATQIMARWPQFVLDEGVHGLFQADGGIAPAALCNAAHIEMASKHGATLLEHHPVSSIEPISDGFELTAGGESFTCERLVIAADAWTNDLLRDLSLELPLTVTQEQVTYWATPRLEDFAPERFPVWIWMDEPCFYGFPVFGEAGVKAGQDVGGREVTAESRSFDVDQDALGRLNGWMETYLPLALGEIIYTKSCLYTLPPDRDFVIDRVPGHDNAFVALGAAHGFKFASFFGKLLSELALDGETVADLAPFAIDRPILTMENPVRSFMI